MDSVAKPLTFDLRDPPKKTSHDEGRGQGRASKLSLGGPQNWSFSLRFWVPSDVTLSTGGGFYSCLVLKFDEIRNGRERIMTKCIGTCDLEVAAFYQWATSMLC